MSLALRAGVLAVALLLPAAARAQAPVPVDPTVAFVTPKPGATLGAGVPARLEAQVSDGIASLVFLVDGLPHCALVNGHWCTWTPGAGDLGSHVIQASVADPQGRTASAEATVVVKQLAPAAVRAKVSRKRLGRRAWRLATKGTVALPLGLTPEACAGGRATITVLDGRRTLVDRTVRVARDRRNGTCAFGSTVSLRVPRGARRVKVTARFEGTALLAPRDSRARAVRVR